jgi:hypothetical protein
MNIPTETVSGLNVSRRTVKKCIGYRITGFSDFFHHPDCKQSEEKTQRFRNWICFRPQVRLALDSALYKPSLWLWYVDDTFVVWPHGPKQLHKLLGHLNSLRPSNRSAMENDLDNVISFLNVLVTQVYRKPTHTGQYLNFKSNYLPPCKKRLDSESSQQSQD